MQQQSTTRSGHPSTATAAAKPEPKVTIPPALEGDAATLRRELAAAVDVIVPLLARVDPINERACDVADMLDPQFDGSNVYSEVSDLVGLEELNRLIQRLLEAMPRAGTDAACVGELTVKRVVE